MRRRNAGSAGHVFHDLSGGATVQQDNGWTVAGRCFLIRIRAVVEVHVLGRTPNLFGTRGRRCGRCG